MMKQTYGRGLKGQMQRGFTLVELAIVLVIAGIILVAVLKGTDAINKAKVERMVADMKGLQGSLLEHQKRLNRFPGDCDNDGVIEIAVPLTKQVGVSGLVDKVERNPMNLQVCGAINAASAASSNDLTATTLVPAAGAGIVTGDIYNLVYNELRRAGVVDGHRTNEELARHGFNDVYLVSSMTEQHATVVQQGNVIIIYGIPVWMAEGIDAEIDGVAQDYGSSSTTAGPACNGRVRRWDNNVTVTALGRQFSCITAAPYGGQYNQGGLSRDDLISIAFQFDPQKLQF